MKKLTKKDKKMRNIAIVSLVAIIVIYSLILLVSYKPKNKYEYVMNGQAFKSNTCYLKDEIAYCRRNGGFIKVDSYYTRN